MKPRRTTTSDRRAASRTQQVHSGGLRLSADRRPGLLLGVAAAGALVIHVAVGIEPAAQADSATESVSVADQLHLTSHHTRTDVSAALEPLEDLVASRNSRQAAETAAQRVQAAADRAELERQKAEARAKAQTAAKAATEAAAKEAAAKEAAAKEAEAAEPQTPEAHGAAAPPSDTSIAGIAQITNSAGAIRPQAQTAADAVVSNVPGAAGITIGGTRPSAADPGGHPSGLALDYMVMSDTALGNAIVQYHIDNWETLGVDYLIYRQRYLASPGGTWSYMEDRGSATANHMDHPHVNYRP